MNYSLKRPRQDDSIPLTLLDSLVTEDELQSTLSSTYTSNYSTGAILGSIKNARVGNFWKCINARTGEGTWSAVTIPELTTLKATVTELQSEVDAITSGSSTLKDLSVTDTLTVGGGFNLECPWKIEEPPSLLMGLGQYLGTWQPVPLQYVVGVTSSIQDQLTNLKTKTDTFTYIPAVAPFSPAVTFNSNKVFIQSGEVTDWVFKKNPLYEIAENNQKSIRLDYLTDLTENVQSALNVLKARSPAFVYNAPTIQYPAASVDFGSNIVFITTTQLTNAVFLNSPTLQDSQGIRKNIRFDYLTDLTSSVQSQMNAMKVKTDTFVTGFSDGDGDINVPYVDFGTNRIYADDFETVKATFKANPRYGSTLKEIKFSFLVDLDSDVQDQLDAINSKANSALGDLLTLNTTTIPGLQGTVGTLSGLVMGEGTGLAATATLAGTNKSAIEGLKGTISDMQKVDSTLSNKTKNITYEEAFPDKFTIATAMFCQDITTSKGVTVGTGNLSVTSGNVSCGGDLVFSTAGKGIKFADNTVLTTASTSTGAMTPTEKTKLAAIGSVVRGTFTGQTTSLVKIVAVTPSSVTLTGPGVWIINAIGNFNNNGTTTTVAQLLIGITTSTASPGTHYSILHLNGATFSGNKQWNMNVTGIFNQLATTTYYLYAQADFGATNGLRMVNDSCKFEAVKLSDVGS